MSTGYFAKIKITKLAERELRAADKYNGRPAETEEYPEILGEFEITAPTLEKLQEKVAAHTDLVEE